MTATGLIAYYERVISDANKKLTTVREELQATPDAATARLVTGDLLQVILSLREALE